MYFGKKIYAITAASVIAFGLVVGGGTYALFTSTATNTSNSFTSGTINLTQDRDFGDAIPGPMFYSNTYDPSGLIPYDTNKNFPLTPGGESLGGWAPGDTVERAMNVTNTGSLAAIIRKIKATVNVETVNGIVPVTSGLPYEEFIDKMTVSVYCPTTHITLYEGSLRGLLNGWADTPPVLAGAAPSGPVNLTFTATLDKSAGNLIQGQSFIFDFSLYAEQRANNSL